MKTAAMKEGVQSQRTPPYVSTVPTLIAVTASSMKSSNKNTNQSLLFICYWTNTSNKTLKETYKILPHCVHFPKGGGK